MAFINYSNERKTMTTIMDGDNMATQIVSNSSATANIKSRLMDKFILVASSRICQSECGDGADEKGKADDGAI